MTMLPALSIRQPWPWAIINADKDIENRNWSTRFRGRFLIHASSKIDGSWDDALKDCSGWAKSAGVPAPWHHEILTGGIVGIADIVDCVDRSDSPWFFGRYGFVLRNARPLQFFACRGKLGFFNVDYPYEVAA